MAAAPTVIFRRNREAIKARVAAKKAADVAYRQQFIDAAAAEASAVEAARKSSVPAPRDDRQLQQTNQRHQQQSGQRR